MRIPAQRQPEPNYQVQYLTPGPGIGLNPAPDTDMAGFISPFAANDNIAGPGRDIEQVLQRQSATYLNGYLAEKVPVQSKTVYQYAHRIRNVPVHSYPERDVESNRAPFLAPNAYTTRRERVKVNAPQQLQLTPGGLVIASMQTVARNVNLNLNKLYKNASAPVSSNYSGKCHK